MAWWAGLALKARTPLASAAFALGRCSRQCSTSHLASSRTSATKKLWQARGAGDPLDVPAAVAGGLLVPGSAGQPSQVHPDVGHCSISIPLASDAWTKDAYSSSVGSLRLGKVLEDIDALAVNAAFKHCSAGACAGGVAGAQEQVHLVTACVDRIDINGPLPTSDLVLDAFVSWTGRSSVEVTVRMFPASAVQDGPGMRTAVTCPPLLQAAVVMVQLDPHTRKSKQVPLLLQPDALAASLAEAGEAASATRQAERARALDRAAPASHELQRVHDQMLKVKAALADMGADSVAAVKHLPAAAVGFPPAMRFVPVVSQAATRRSTSVLTHPQDRNTAGAVFGGLLMRRAYELAQVVATEACLAACERWPADAPGGSCALPRLVGVDDIAFVRPVPVGCILRMQGCVTSTTGAALQVAVQCTVQRADQPGQPAQHTNSFHFTFASMSLDSCRSPGTQPVFAMAAAVVPETYDEVMQSIDGARRLQASHAHATSSGSLYAPAFQEGMEDRT